MPDGSCLKAGQGGFTDNFTSLFNKTLVKTAFCVCLCARVTILLSVVPQISRKMTHP